MFMLSWGIKALSLAKLAQCFNEESQLALEPRLVQLADESIVRVEPEQFDALIKSEVAFMDVTSHPANNNIRKISASYPTNFTQETLFDKLAQQIDPVLLEEHLTGLSSFHTRFCKSDLGLEASLWLYNLIKLTGAELDNFSVELFDHDLKQKSVIARITGSENPDDVVVLGAHLDSINLNNYFEGRAPGADDNGSGSVTTLEVLRLLALAGFKPRNTVEFHWYAAEEIGLIGSQDVFEAYHKEGKQVKAMFQQDMTGGTNRDRGVADDFGIIEDFVDPELTSFVKQIIDQYADIPWVSASCGYACSDHASAYKYGFPSSFVIEYGTPASIPDQGPRIGHNELDTVDRINFKHMVQHVKISLGVALELGVADL